MGVILAHNSLFHGGKHDKTDYLKELDSDDLLKWRQVRKVVNASVVPLPYGIPMRVMYIAERTRAGDEDITYTIEWNSLSILYSDTPLFITDKGFKPSGFQHRQSKYTVAGPTFDSATLPFETRLPDKINGFIGRSLPEEFQVERDGDHPLRIWIYFVVSSGISPIRKETFASNQRRGSYAYRWEDGETPDTLELPCWANTLPDPEASYSEWLTNRFQLYIYDVVFLRKLSDHSTHFDRWSPYTVIEAIEGKHFTQYSSSSISYPVDMVSIVGVKWFCHRYTPVNRLGRRVLLTNPNSRDTRNLLWAASWFRPNFKLQVEDKAGTILYQPARRIKF